MFGIDTTETQVPKHQKSRVPTTVHLYIHCTHYTHRVRQQTHYTQCTFPTAHTLHTDVEKPNSQNTSPEKHIPSEIVHNATPSTTP